MVPGTMKRRAPLDVQLRFWPDPVAAHWLALIDALVGWDPRLRADSYEVLIGDADARLREAPWGADTAQTLARRCAGGDAFLWQMVSDDDHRWGCGGRGGWIKLDLQVPLRANSAADLYLALLAALPATCRPAMAMLTSAADPSVIFGLQGLQGLEDLPPLLHLDRRALAQIRGGADAARATPCQLRDAPDGGLLFVVRPDPFRRPSQDDELRAREVAAYLGIGGEAHPLVLTPPGG